MGKSKFYLGIYKDKYLNNTFLKILVRKAIISVIISNKQLDMLLYLGLVKVRYKCFEEMESWEGYPE